MAGRSLQPFNGRSCAHLQVLMQCWVFCLSHLVLCMVGQFLFLLMLTHLQLWQLVYKWAFEFGSVSPDVLSKSSIEAVSVAVLFCCCSVKPSMWKTFYLIHLKEKAKWGFRLFVCCFLLWQLQAERKELRLLFACGCSMSGLESMRTSPWVRAEICGDVLRPAANTSARIGWANNDLLFLSPCYESGGWSLRCFQNQLLSLCVYYRLSQL